MFWIAVLVVKLQTGTLPSIMLYGFEVWVAMMRKCRQLVTPAHTTCRSLSGFFEGQRGVSKEME